MENRCRLCAECSTDQSNIFDDLELISQIFQLYNLKIEIKDKLPNTICLLCLERVRQAWEFRENIKKSQQFLLELLNNEQESVANDELLHQNLEQETSIQFMAIEQEDLLTISKEEKAKKKEPFLPKHKKKKRNAELSDFECNGDGSVTPNVYTDGWDSYPWVCCECLLTAANSDDLRDHYATVHSQPARYSCTDCPKVYIKYLQFISHVCSHRTKLRFCCDICYKWFPNERAQEKHRIEHKIDLPNLCTTCGKRFRSTSSLHYHMRSHLPSEIKNKYPCDLCPKRFSSKPNLMQHKKIHIGVRNFTCHECGKTFIQKGNLDNHLHTHSTSKPFSCSTCGKSFKTAMRLKKHSTIHTGLKPHQCDICGRQFREKGTLREHYRIHTGVMPYSCEICGKTFRFKTVLTCHKRQHTGERPYSCNECQHHFSNWSNYNKHMKRRHGINTSKTVRKPQSIPPTGMPNRNPPGTVLAPPLAMPLTESFVGAPTTFYPVMNMYTLPDEILQQRV